MKFRIVLLLATFLSVTRFAAELPSANAAEPQAAHAAGQNADADAAGRYFWGYGVKRDYNMAMKLWLQAADAGDPVASFNIGAMYEDGWGVRRDYAEAMKWYRRSADLGNANAERNIGQVYAGGWGVSQDAAEAAKWYRKAADQGDYVAELAIGAIYQRGDSGIKQDYAQAYQWLSLAAAATKDTSTFDTHVVENFDKTIVAYAASQRDALAAKMSPEQLAEGKRLLAAWKVTPFRAGAAAPADVVANSKAAVEFHDYQSALKGLLPLANQGNAVAEEKVGTLYAQGQDGANRNYGEAIKWYQKAAQQGNARAEASIGWMYQNGWGTRRDLTEAAKWYLMAANLGDVVAERNMGQVYAGGWGVKQDYPTAATWYRKAADQGDYISQLALGGMYQRGNGVPVDMKQAYVWLSLAAAAKDTSKNDYTIVEGFDPSIVEYASKQRDGLGAKLTPQQLEEAKALAASSRQPGGRP